MLVSTRDHAVHSTIELYPVIADLQFKMYRNMDGCSKGSMLTESVTDYLLASFLASPFVCLALPAANKIVFTMTQYTYIGAA